MRTGWQDGASLSKKLLITDGKDQRTASFIALPMLNLTVVFAGILITAPVAGLRPSRALRKVFFNLPNPGSVNSPFFFTSLVARAARASNILLTSDFLAPVESAKLLMISVCVIRAII